MRTEGLEGVLLSALLVTSLIVPLLSSSLSSNLSSASPSPDSPENFIIVALPDTQLYSQSYPSIFENQTEWIVQNENEKNIVFVTHLGDIVQNYNNDTEWQNADNAMSILDNEVPYGILAGNHDMSPSGEAAEYEGHFPASRFENYDYWGGSYDQNKNNYQLFSTGGMDFIALNLEYRPPDNVLDWADNVLDNYPNRRAIISTHEYLDANGNRRSNGGTSIWDNLVVPHNNVFLVLCGHKLGEAERSDTLDNRTVHQLLADYQFRPNGGNGWLRIMEFVPNEDKIYVRTYSPYLDQYETDENSQFELSYPMDWGLAVSTLGAENIGYTSADIKGELENLGGVSSAEVWFQWRESGASTWENTFKENLSSPQEFSESLSGLSEGTTYYFRARASNPSATVYGRDQTFTTLPFWTGTAVFNLIDLYTVNVEKILDLENGSKLVVKFYTYGDVFENENVIETFTPPWHVEENESVPHPEGIGVKKARLDLTTDDTENVISTIATFTATRDVLHDLNVRIYMWWPFCPPENRSELFAMISDKYLQWPFAP